MRTRVIKPEFWRDVKIAGLPLEVRLVYIGLWNEADDSGYFRWQPRQLALDLFPDLSETVVAKLLSDASRLLKRRGRLIRMACGHAIIPNLPKHQWLAGDPKKQAHTYRREHERGECPAKPRGGAKGSPRGGSKGDRSLPNSRVESSRVDNSQYPAGAHEDGARDTDETLETGSGESEWRRRVAPPPGYPDRKH